MPTYVYKFVESGETIEVQQGFHEDALTEIAHPASGEVLPVKKVFLPVGVTFKGSGFFKTDNRGKSSASNSSDASGSKPASSESKGDGAGSKKSESSSNSSSDSGGSAAKSSSASSGSSSDS
jgi:predicted nucleic acid-binding Zn ribbon protein